MSTANIFRKQAKEFEINGEKILVSPLKVGTLMRIQGLSKTVSEAIAKLRSVIVNDYEQIKNSKPNPTSEDKDAIEYYEKTTHKAPEISAISMVIQNKQEGVKALFDCLFQNELLETILRTSVDRFKEVPKGELFNEESDFAIDLPTALEVFIAIVEVNAGGFTELGKFSHLLTKLQGVVKAKE